MRKEQERKFTHKYAQNSPSNKVDKNLIFQAGKSSKLLVNNSYSLGYQLFFL